jgi:SAM-dependent methyltransferase
MEDHPHGHHAHGSSGGPDEAAMAELLDLDGEVLHSYLCEVTAWIHDLAAGSPVRRILDLGCGTGTGTFALLEQFGQADAIAVDLSAYLLEHLGEQARRLGVADRIRTVQADLGSAWPAIDTVDLVWASSSLHHMDDPHGVLVEVLSLLRPGGLLGVAELDSFPRFLPDDIGIGAPGLEARAHAIAAERRAAALPHLGSDWGVHLSAAGFTIEAVRTFTIELAPPLPASTPRYAQASLARMRTGLEGQMSHEDLAALDILIESDGADGVLQRGALTVEAKRTVWIARRPSDS